MLKYEDAMHGMQTGVAFEMEKGSFDTTPKHLRVGINSCLINDAALVRLLIAKGLFTEEEYALEITKEANRELERYEDRIRDRYGANIKLR